MKICTLCGLRKVDVEFRPRGDRKGKRRSRCNDCTRQSDRIDSKLRCAVGKNSAYLSARRFRNTRFLLDYLTGKSCVDCGESDILVLEFDHVRGTKIASISKMTARTSIKTIKSEIEKCEVRCSNCHARVTHKRANTLKWQLVTSI